MAHTKQELYFFYIVAFLSLVAALVFLGGYLAIIAFAILIALLFYPMYHKVLKWVGGRSWLALPISFAGVVLTFVLPFALAGGLAYQVIADFVHHIEGSNISSTFSLPWIASHGNHFLQHIPGVTYRLSPDQLSSQFQQAIVSLSSHWLGNLSDFGQAVLALVPAVIVGIYVIGAIFSNYDRIGRYLHDLSPLSDEIDRMYLSRIKAMGLSMVRGTFVIALVQGVIVGLLLWIAGVKYAAFLGLLAVLTSVIPMGAGMIMIPIGIFLILTGQVWQGLLQIFGCAFIVANVDNVLRPRLVSKEAALPPALTIIGLFAGLAHFGFLGVIYGPVLMIFFATTVEVYLRYFRQQRA